MPAYYLDTFVGDGSYFNPFRSRGGGQIIDLRPDNTVTDGNCLTAQPERADGLGRTLLGLTGDLDKVSLAANTALTSPLSMTLEATTLRDMIVELAVQGTKWATASPTANGVLEVHLGGLLYSRRGIKGGAAFTETFTHANQANSLTADLTWTSIEGGWWSIVSNQASLSNIRYENSARADVDTSTNDHTVTSRWVSDTFVTGNAAIALFGRKDSSATVTCYVQDGSRNGTADDRKCSLYKRVAGAWTLLSTAGALTPAWVDNDQMRLTCNGSSITMGNITQGLSNTTTDSSIPTGTRGGYRGYVDNAGNAILADTWTIADIAVSGTISYMTHYARKTRR